MPRPGEKISDNVVFYLISRFASDYVHDCFHKFNANPRPACLARIKRWSSFSPRQQELALKLMLEDIQLIREEELKKNRLLLSDLV